LAFYFALKGGEGMKIEIRNDSIVIQGYVNSVDRYSKVLPSPRGKFREKILPRTFEKALKQSENVDLLYNHRKDRKLGSTAEKSLELREDNIGLYATATIVDDEVRELAKEGKLRGWSFGFISLKDSWKDGGEDGIQKRSISDLHLSEVSILTNSPAYVGNSIETRGEEMLVFELRNEQLEEVIVTDNSTVNTETNNSENFAENREIPDFSCLEHEILILQLEGRL
jgi:Escherichia/Staphylococcus phage prohead protease